LGSPHVFPPQDLGPDDGRGLDAAELLEGHGSRGLHGTSALGDGKFDGKIQKSMEIVDLPIENADFP